jgi:Conjugal transfer protein TrbH.
MIKKILFIIFSLFLFWGCASAPQKNIVNVKFDKLSNDYISSDITILLKNIYSPAQTNIVINVKNNKNFNESLQSALRSVGYSVREIRHKEAAIYPNELQLEYVIDKIKETSEEKRIRKINNDNSIIFRVSVIIDNKMYSRMYKLYKNYEISAISRWLESDIISF